MDLADRLSTIHRRPRLIDGGHQKRRTEGRPRLKGGESEDRHRCTAFGRDGFFYLSTPSPPIQCLPSGGHTFLPRLAVYRTVFPARRTRLHPNAPPRHSPTVSWDVLGPISQPARDGSGSRGRVAAFATSPCPVQVFPSLSSFPPYRGSLAGRSILTRPMPSVTGQLDASYTLPTGVEGNLGLGGVASCGIPWDAFHRLSPLLSLAVF